MTLTEAMVHNGSYAVNHSIGPAIVVEQRLKFKLDFGATPSQHVYIVYSSNRTPPQDRPGPPGVEGPPLFEAPDLAQVSAYLAQTGNPVPTHQLDAQAWT